VRAGAGAAQVGNAEADYDQRLHGGLLRLPQAQVPASTDLQPVVDHPNDAATDNSGDDCPCFPAHSRTAQGAGEWIADDESHRDDQAAHGRSTRFGGVLGY
jgi:hypothetical protein